MAEYIEKDKAINTVFEAFADGRSAYIAIEAIPAADVQPVRHGQWIPVDEMEDAFDCSECDAMVSKRLNYCPNCGAKMDKEEE